MEKRRGTERLLACSVSWLVAAVFLCISGCGSGTGRLHGIIKYQGKLVRQGSVQVVGSDGVPRPTTIQDDGSYAIENIPAGPIQIAVNSPNPKTIRVAPPKVGRYNPPIPDSTNWFAIPESYASFSQSGLTFTLKPGSNRHDINLE